MTAYKYIILLVLTLNSFCLADNVFKKDIVLSSKGFKVKHETRNKHSLGTVLVLSGGGARGLAHIGVIKALEDEKIPIDMIVGTSIGSVIGGLYASGYSTDEIESIFREIDWDTIYRDEAERTSMLMGQKGKDDRYLVTIRFEGLNPYIPPAFSPGQKILNVLSEILLRAPYHPHDSFNDLKIKFRAVATDLISGRQIVLDHGNIAECIHGSMAVPLLFSPIDLDTLLLVDGGLRSNLPVNVAVDEGADFIIAVDITAQLRSKDEISVPWQIVDQATTIMADLSNKLQSQQADVVIRPDLSEFVSSNFTDLDTLIKIGYQTAIENIGIIKRKSNLATSDSLPFFINDLVHIICNEPEVIKKLVNCDSIINKKGTLITDDIIENDLNSLMSTGYINSITVSSDSLNLFYNLSSFPRFSGLELTGVSLFNPDTLISKLGFANNDIFNYIVFNEWLEFLINQYRDAGYSLTRIDTIVTDGLGKYYVTLDEGMIDSILVEGNKKTLDYVILRDFNVLRENVFNWSPVQDAIDKAYATQLFDRVGVHIVQNDNANFLKIKVKEKSSFLLRLGGKVDIDRKSQLYLEVGDENILGTGIKALSIGRIGIKDTYFGVDLRDDRIFTTFFTIILKGYTSREINPYTVDRNIIGDYNEDRTGVSLRIGYQMQSLGQMSGEIRLENVKNFTEDEMVNIDQNIELRTFAIRSITDRRDKIDFTKKGIYTHWAWESGNQLLLNSQESFSKAYINIKGYQTWLNRHTLQFRVNVGLGDKSIPFSEYFRLGGLHDFFGLKENQYYGKQLFIGSLGYRFCLPGNLSKSTILFDDLFLGIRYDIGGLWNEPQLVFKRDDFFAGYGAYLAASTFLGPLYLAWGKTTRNDEMLYLSLGFSF